MARGLWGLVAFLTLTACIGGFGGDSSKAALSVPEVEVSALLPLGEPAAADATGLVMAVEAAPVAPETAPAEGTAAPAPEAEVAAPTAARKTAAQLACEAQGGRWAKVGAGSLMTCVRRLKDAMKTCQSAQDCSGMCLARSNSCAPYQPMFGCHEILDDLGRRMTQCLN